MAGIHFASRSEQGPRPSHQDRTLVIAPDSNPDGLALVEFGMLFAVADGAGAHQAGEVASQMAVDGLKDYYRGPTAGRGDIASRAAELLSVVHRVNRAVFEKSVSANEFFMMGTTLSALVIWHVTALFVHIGDSRIYRLRRGQLRQLTCDQTEVQHRVEDGEISAEEALTHPRRHRLDQALGGDPDLELLGMGCERVVSGDVYLLSTDGLTNTIADNELTRILLEHREPKAAADFLVEEALRRGSDDNATAIVIRIGKTKYGILSDD